MQEQGKHNKKRSADFDPLLVERGKRVKKVRLMLGMTLKEFADFCESGFSTICQWEHGRLGGLAQKSARRIIVALQATNLTCTEEWLLYGTAPGPGFKNSKSAIATEATYHVSEPSAVYHTSIPLEPSNHVQEIKTELEQFRNRHPDALVLHLTDDLMSPGYKKDDLLAGLLIPMASAEQFIGDIVLAQTITGQVLLRKLEQRISPTIFRLSTYNLTGQQEKHNLDAELIHLAEIVRLWRVPVTT